MSDYFFKGMERGFLSLLRAEQPNADWEIVPLDSADGSAGALLDAGLDRVADLDSVGEIALTGSDPHGTDSEAE